MIKTSFKFFIIVTYFYTPVFHSFYSIRELVLECESNHHQLNSSFAFHSFRRAYVLLILHRLVV